jgi:predicted nucleic acid-binding protein
VFSFDQSKDVRRANYVIIGNNTLSLTNWSNGGRNETYHKGGGAVQSEIVRNEIESALIKAANTVMPNLQKEAIIAIINMSSDNSEVSEFITGELEYILVNNKFNVVDRSQLDKIRQEQKFQLSEDVDDNTAVTMGKFAGANVVITGAISGSGDMRRLRLRALDTQTARVIGVASEALPDRTSSQSKAVPDTSSRSTAANVPSQSASFKIGDRGPAGGIVFYDKGSSSDGWRYLEAAPAETEFTAQWYSGADTHRWYLSDGIGSGKWNTEQMMRYSDQYPAARLCVRINSNGFNDWFLPSIEELDLMYKNLKQKDLGNFSNNMYWSSSVVEKGYRARYLRFIDGRHNYGEMTKSLFVRAVRA